MLGSGVVRGNGRSFACGYRARYSVIIVLIEGLTLRQLRFAHRVAEEPNESATSIAISVGYSKPSAGESASLNLKNPKILEAIQDRKLQLAAAAGITPEWILREWFAIASANPADLVSIVYVACGDCWALADDELPPNPDCSKCKGQGVRYVKVADTRKLTGAARKLYAGAKQTKDGVEIKMRDQDAALKNLADYLGMQNKGTTALTGPGGGPVQLAAARPEDLTDEQLAALCGAHIESLGVSQGVPSAGALPSVTIDATLEPF